MLVVVDPYPTVSAVVAGPEGWRLSFTSLYPVLRHVVLSQPPNRSLQWRDKVVEPLFRVKGLITGLLPVFAEKFGFS